MKKAILVTTIGTRDLALYREDYQQKWLNVGNSFKSDIDGEDSPAVRVQYQLGIQDSFRNVTKYLFENWEQYQDKLIPIIIGKLIEDKKDELKTIYLVVTDQEGVARAKYCEKDTLYSGKIIKKYIEKNYDIEVKILPQGQENENPANFEQMFVWWKKFWEAINPNHQKDKELLMCLKGGVNQSSEAARITSIIEFEEQVIFYDFEEKESDNLQGIPSNYTAPFTGINYLWSRKQAEALSLLERYDYEGVNFILKPYYLDSQNENIKKLKPILNKAIKWNITDFDTFIGGLREIPQNNWWWKGYESAYLGYVRLQQDRNIEAFFHAFRAIEGLMSELISFQYSDYLETPSGDTPYLSSTICDRNNSYSEFNDSQNLFKNGKAYLYGNSLDRLVETALPVIKNDQQWGRFFRNIKPWRNRVFHRFRHLTTSDLFSTCWEVDNHQQWKNKVLYYLNSLSGQNYSSLEEASLMAEYHHKIKDSITKYSPQIKI